MKRVLYILLVAGFAATLAGCGDSGGGYWSATPMAAPAGSQVQPLGGQNAQQMANNLFNAANGGGGVSAAVAGSLGACPALSDMGLAMPSSFGTPAFSAPASIVAGNRTTRQNSAAKAAGMSLASADNGFVKFAYKTSTQEYNFYVKYLKADGTALVADITDTRTNFFAFTAGSLTDVDAVEFYGDWKYTYVTTSTGASCNVLANTSSSANYSLTGTYGSAASPCFVGGLTGTAQYMKMDSTWKVQGTFDGTPYDVTMTSKMYGDASYLSRTNLFTYGPTSTNYYGMGKFEFILNNGTVVLVHAQGTQFAYYVNGELVYSYPSTSSSSGQPTCSIVK